MFAPTSRSRLGCQNVCVSCLRRVFHRSNAFVRHPSGYQRLSSTAAKETSDDSHGDAKALTISKVKVFVQHHSKNARMKLRRRARNAALSPLSSNTKAMSALKKALQDEDGIKENDVLKGMETSNPSGNSKNSVTDIRQDAKNSQTAKPDIRDSAGKSSKPPSKKTKSGSVEPLKANKISTSLAKDIQNETESSQKAGPKSRDPASTSSKQLSKELQTQKSKKLPFNKRAITVKNVPSSMTLEDTQNAPGSSTAKPPSSKVPTENSSIIRHFMSTDKTPASKKISGGVRIPSVNEDLVLRLRQIANDERRIMTKRTLIKLLQEGALTDEGRKIAMRDIRRSLVTKIHPGIQDIIDEASSRGPVLETQSTIKEAMQGKPSTKANKKSGEEESEAPIVIKPIKKSPSYKEYEIKSVDAIDLKLTPYEMPQPPVPTLAYGLERALFNPGVYHLRDPRSRVFNFDPYLQSIMPVADFDFNALKEYITSSRDEALIGAATYLKKKYTGSTSSMTSALAHFHYVLSHWRDVNTTNLSKGFPADMLTFTAVQRSPAAIFLRWKDGTYAIDADKHYDTPNILSMLGKSMEKLLTLPTEDYERYRKENSHQISEEERDEVEAYHYTTMGDFLMRSQLDAYDPRLPGTGMFDLKTRAVVAIRADAENYHQGVGYEILGRHGEYHSFEREYYDMIRSAFLKYSLQVRMGRMDGIFVAFHNTERIFGFQYISLNEMDLALHGTEDTTIGDSEFKLSLELLNRVLDRATAKYPEQSLHIHFEARPSTGAPFLYIFATPVTDDEIGKIQNTNKAEIEKFERRVLGLHTDKAGEDMEKEEVDAQREEAQAGWEALQAEVEENIEDEMVSGEISSDGMDDQRGEQEGPGAITEVDCSISTEGIRDDFEQLVENDEIGASIRVDDEETERRIEAILSAVNSSESINNTKDEEELVDNIKHGNVSEGKGLQMESDQQDESADQRPTDRNVSESGDEGQSDSEDEISAKIASGNAIETEESTLSKEEEPVQEDKDHIVDENESEDQNEGDLTGHSTAPKEAKSGGKHKDEDLLGMFLTIRNKVNGEYVQRPEKLTRDDNWTLEYALAEIPEPKSRTIYQSILTRRKQTLMSSKRNDLSKFRQMYQDKLDELIEQSKAFRQQQDELDKVEPLKVFSVDGSKGKDARSGEST